MNRKLFSTILMKDENIRLDYFLLSREHKNTAGNLVREYGVEIRQSPAGSFSLCPYAMTSIPDISCQKEDMENLLNMLSESATDPSCLVDIIEDWID